jgi:hypothetical protein
LGRPNNIRKGLWVTHCQIRKHFSIQTDTGLIEAMDQSTIGKTVLSSCGRDANNPEPAKLSLLLSSVAVGITQRLDDLLFGSLMQLALVPPIALGLPQNFLSALQPFISSSYSTHRSILSQFEHHLDTLLITGTHLRPFPQISLSLGRFLGQDMTVMAVSPFDFP